jgi:hypothetical protein
VYRQRDNQNAEGLAWMSRQCSSRFFFFFLLTDSLTEQSTCRATSSTASSKPWSLPWKPSSTPAPPGTYDVHTVSRSETITAPAKPSCAAWINVGWLAGWLAGWLGADR